MEVRLDEGLITEIEAKAAELARGAGAILSGHFGRPLEVEYKDDKKQDPVTLADKESQDYLSKAISGSFPEHGIVGEEDSQESEGPASEFLWILDPLDGTTNFLNGLPIYGVSIGVLHRGVPIASALFIPWPGEHGGVVLHARRGGGAWIGEERLTIPNADGPEANRPIGLPASFGGQFRFGKEMRRRVGQVRITGSIAYELALTACGQLQYAIIGGPRIWDVAGGVLIVAEAGGTVLVRSRGSRRWEPLNVVGPSWEAGAPNLKEVRSWTAPMVLGNERVASFVAANLQRRGRSLPTRVVALLKSIFHGGGKSK